MVTLGSVYKNVGGGMYPVIEAGRSIRSPPTRRSWILKLSFLVVILLSSKLLEGGYMGDYMGDYCRGY